jgi:hypothetical protein
MMYIPSTFGWVLGGYGRRRLGPVAGVITNNLKIKLLFVSVSDSCQGQI